MSEAERVARCARAVALLDRAQRDGDDEEDEMQARGIYNRACRAAVAMLEGRTPLDAPQGGRS